MQYFTFKKKKKEILFLSWAHKLMDRRVKNAKDQDPQKRLLVVVTGGAICFLLHRGGLHGIFHLIWSLLFLPEEMTYII